MKKKIELTPDDLKQYKAALQRLLNDMIWLRELCVDGYVVVDQNEEVYCVTVTRDGDATVELGHRPHIFSTEERATHTAANFRARSGNGPIAWKAMTAELFAANRLVKLEDVASHFRTIIDEAEKNMKS